MKNPAKQGCLHFSDTSPILLNHHKNQSRRIIYDCTKLVLSAQPAEAGAIVYLPLSPKTAGAEASGQVALKITIKNNEAKTVTMKNLVVAFTGAPASPAVAIPLLVGVKNSITNVAEMKPLQIAAGASVSWFFQPENNITVPVPPPPRSDQDEHQRRHFH